MATTTRGRHGGGVLPWVVTALLVLALAAALAWPAISDALAPPPAGANTLLAAAPEEVARARKDLDGLAVVPRPPFDPGYSRAAFGDAWTDTDRNGCNQRDDVLLRDLVASRPHRVQRQGSCDHDVLAGTWVDPYTGREITLTDAKAQSEEVQIDHIVALSVAWRYGAGGWTDARRLAFANDLGNLLAVGGGTNKDKAGSDAARWRPAPAAQCGFAVRYVTVKSRYALATDLSEKRALAAMLGTCD